MLKIAYKFLILFVVVLSIAALLNSIIGLPFYWGNQQLASKHLYLKDQPEQPRAYFIGSSITYHAVDPAIFCEGTNKPKNYAFNLGIDGAQPPQTFYLVEELLKKEAPIDYIFFELNSFDQMADHLFQTTRSKYYYRLDHLWMSINYFIASNYLEKAGLRITHKLGLIAKHGITFIERIFNIGMRKEVIQTLTNTIPTSETATKKYGYSPLLANRKKRKADIDQLLKELTASKKKFVAAYSEQPNQAEYNRVLQAVLMDLIHQAKAKKIRLVYLLTPFKCSFDGVPEMRALFDSLPPSNRIDLANPNKYPAFYEVANRWDIGHLNDAGAKLYTQKLSELTNQLPN